VKIGERLYPLDPQSFQQCPGLLQVSRDRALGEPVVDRCQQLVDLGTLALMLPSRLKLSAARSSRDFTCCRQARA
jgi:hypothetical protein